MAGLLSPRPRFRRLLLAALLWLAGHGAALAAVEIGFYSREAGGSHFPHAFVRLSGTIDATGAAVETTYGFTARSITPAILLGSVSGEIVVEAPAQVARSQRQFALVLSDRQYDAVLAVVERWRSRRQPSYNLNRRNCVHFVAELAQALGLRVANAERLMKRPRAFLEHVRSLNPGLTNPR
ncbi:MAG TPA: hypothetical protein VN231_00325 [Allosphingosinicella sp.]|nr:hypothetical protein [Allosphingosinicella sp.]HYC80560.1 hypothetical protein [Solirubrobacterales bacterium]